ncbi:MAG: phytanoyl-CoA dioxygenase family protein [Gemmatimonadetes bacterium]|nr:phytanoyl-CoA dioxygenase family protein [Gemmatimonadota bacterium]MYH20256.1 phytanoyl-CoA dioxygenase family protein [Gemmatimonadota bacterium]MYK98576.1 phytanoyl-CoA dioxygenase family protein [Gemmatimonadota bacterium]
MTQKSLSIQLTDGQIARFHEEGYLVVPDLLAADEVESFVRHQADPEAESLKQGLRTHLSDPFWRRLAHHPNVAGVARQILGGRPRIVQTMYMAKEPARPDEELGGAGISLHQDSHYLPNEPDTLMACWIAMSDTDPENGGLCVAPGSHKDNLRETTLNTNPEHMSWENDYGMRSPDGREWTEKLYSFDVVGIEEADLVRLTVPRGSGVFFTSRTVHGSYANRSHTRPRLAFAVHYVKDGTWVFRTDVQDTTPVDLPGA